jgi:hypothetical protein
MRSQLFRMGMPFEIRLMSDLAAGRVPKAKAYVFLNAFRLTGAEREAIAEATRGAAAIWLYAGGLLDDGPAPDAVAGDEVPTSSSATALPIVRGTPQPGRVTPLAGEPYGTELVLDPLLNVREQGGVEVLGRYADGSVAAAAKDGPDGLRAYIGAVHCPASVLRDLLARGGVHVWCDSDDVVLTDGSFLGLSATHPGQKTLRLPAACSVTDLLTGETIATGATSVSLDIALGETRLLRFSR